MRYSSDTPSWRVKNKSEERAMHEVSFLYIFPLSSILLGLHLDGPLSLHHQPLLGRPLFRKNKGVVPLIIHTGKYGSARHGNDDERAAIHHITAHTHTLPQTLPPKIRNIILIIKLPKRVDQDRGIKRHATLRSISAIAEEVV